MSDTSRAVSVTEIKGVKGLVPLHLAELWEYRELILFFLWRDVKGRYKQTALGPLWMVLSPLISMGLYWIISSVAGLPSDDVPRPLFIYSAMLPWTFFTRSVMAAAGSLRQYKALISKIYFPRLIIPIVGVLSSAVDFLISFLLLLGMTVAYGYHLGWGIFVLPVFLVLAAMTALAVGLWSASWIVHFWDVNTVLTYVIRLWMYMSPVVYATSFIPEKWQPLYHLNPMTNMIEGFRWYLLGVGRPPDIMLLVSFLIVIPILISGAYYFRRTERNIVDIA